jgi:hypothetical protein
MPRFKLVARPDEPAAESLHFKWAADEIGKRHQLGGGPTELQLVSWPRCEVCSQEMTFFGQLDAPGDEFDLGDCGLVQVFVCFDCLETHSRLVGY